MIDILTVATLLSSSNIIRNIFQAILTNRSMKYKDLRISLGEQNIEEDEKTIQDALKKLKDADLIKEQLAPIEDFSTYYVTADGLNVERKLHLVEMVQSSVAR